MNSILDLLRRWRGPKPSNVYRDLDYRSQTITVQTIHPGYLWVRLYERGVYGGNMVVTDYELGRRYVRET